MPSNVAAVGRTEIDLKSSTQHLSYPFEHLSMLRILDRSVFIGSMSCCEVAKLQREDEGHGGLWSLAKRRSGGDADADAAVAA